MPTGNDSLANTPPARKVAFLAGGLALVLLGAAGCRRDMYDQPKYDAYDPSTFFRDGSSSRQQIEGTVARTDLQADYQAVYDGGAQVQKTSIAYFKSHPHGKADDAALEPGQPDHDLRPPGSKRLAFVEPILRRSWRMRGWRHGAVGL